MRNAGEHIHLRDGIRGFALRVNQSEVAIETKNVRCVARHFMMIVRKTIPNIVAIDAVDWRITFRRLIG